jgi:translation initiation factor 1
VLRAAFARYNPSMPQNRVVYDSAVGRLDRCSNCKRRIEACVCPPSTPGAPPRGDGIVRVSRDKKQRRGKTVTVVTGLPGDAAALAEVAGTLKRLCGSGGTVSSDTVEIQGDHRERIAAKLTELGHTVKLAGG